MNNTRGNGTKRLAPLSRRPAFEALEHRTLLAGDPILDGQPVIISEFVADSTATLLTRTRATAEDAFAGLAESPDWIELLNISDTRLDIGGMHLSDDASFSTKWRFPAGTSIEAGGFLVVFASGRNVTDPALDERGLLHTNFRLSGDAEYLALTNRDGAVIHEFAPTYPAQRVDVSYGIPMTTRALIGPNAPVEYLVPTNDSLEPQWRSPGFTDPRLVSGNTHSPVGFDRGNGPPETGETIGFEPIKRASGDFSRGSIVVLESMPFTVSGRVSEWSFYSETTRSITPLILRSAGGEFEIVGVGMTRASDGSGAQTFAFELQSGSAAVEPSQYFFGYKDGDNQRDEAGLISWTGSNVDSVRRYNGPLSGKMIVGQQLTGGSRFGRTYSVRATTRAALAGPINTLVESAMANATSLYARIPFVVDQLDSLRSLTLQVRYDDGFVAYLNGVEVARRNIPVEVQFDSTASSNRPLRDANRFEDINISQFRRALMPGQNVLAIHGFNDDIAGAEFLVDARLAGVDLASAMGGGFAADPTPGTANGLIYRDFVAVPSFSQPRGFYDQPFTLRLTVPGTPEATIYYTQDGSDPTPGNPRAIAYQQPLEINRTAFLRAASYHDGLLPSVAVTQTYIFPADVATQSTLQPAVVQDPVWGPQFTDSLKSLPTVSLVTANPISVEGEYPTSAELIYPDGTAGFQVNAGVEVFGGTAVSFPKRSLRLSFKNIYGPSTLNFDVFQDPDSVSEFDQLLLRPGSHDTPFWNGSVGVGNYIRNRWASDRQLEMGQPAPRSKFVHLYLNGVYWGVFDLMERPNAAFMASHFGGDPEDYDVLNAGTPIDGDDLAWKALLEALDDGYDEVKKYLDVVNYADYVLLQFYGGNNIDWAPAGNWMAARKREPGAGFQFFTWDSDIILRSGANTDIVNYGGPGYLLTQKGGITQYPEFRRLLAERAQKHFFDGGILTAENLRRRIDELAAQTRSSIIAETARWGSGRYTPATWESAIEWIKNTYAPADGPARELTVIEQMRRAGLFPLSDTPQFLVDGQPLLEDRVEPGTLLAMTAPEGAIYYTLDGSDPWEKTPTVEHTDLIAESSPVRVLIPRDNSAGTDWRGVEFDDSNWLRGDNGIGYETNDEFGSLIRLNVQEAMKNVNSTAYVRIPFHVDDPARFDSLELSVRYDDGFIAYLNGEEVARRNAAGSASWNARSSAVRANIEAIEFERFNLARVKHLLRSGDNVLSIHALNNEPANVDFLITPRLRAGRVVDTGLAESAIRYVSPIQVPPNASIRARTVWGAEWSPPRTATVTTQPFPLRVSEVMYHAFAPTEAELAAGFSNADDFEFIELVNISNATMELAGIELVQTTVGDQTEGVTFDLGRGSIRRLEPGQRLVIVENLAAFELRYGTRLPVTGQWTGGLSNSSEQITLMSDGQIRQQFIYDDNWYSATDGQGSSLEIVDASYPDLNRWNLSSGWRPSDVVGGTPGTDSRGAVVGDFNQDGVFDSSDLLSIVVAGEFEDNLPGNSTFEEGDWNGDGDFTTADLVLIFQLGTYVDGAEPRRARSADSTRTSSLDGFDRQRAVAWWAETNWQSQARRRLDESWESDQSLAARDALFARLSAEPVA
jgi:hypothetical protein